MDTMDFTAGPRGPIASELSDNSLSTDGEKSGAALLPPDSRLLKDLTVTLEARLGEAVIPLAELMALRTGAVLDLDTRLNEPVALYLNGTLVGHGEIVAVDDRFGVRITEIATS